MNNIAIKTYPAFWYKTVLLLSLSIFVLVVSNFTYAAGPTQSEALAILKKNGMSPYKTKVPIGLVKIETMSDGIELINGAREDNVSKAYGCLEKFGYLKFKVKFKESERLNHRYTHSISTAPKIYQIKGNVFRKRIPDYRLMFTFNVADRIPKKIIGIRDIGNGIVLVDFVWDFKRNTDIAACLLSKKPRFRIGQAILANWNYGWQVEKIKEYRWKKI